ncbi:MAG: type II toxin-antitoxin system HicA family toxin [Candidatus Flexifilum sp.]|jgi:predicted RNA binding protein YcfA (HicA-like mRNA interferase family)
MPPLPVISGRECVRVLTLIGFAIDRQRGSHIIMRREQPPPTRTVVVPDHREIDRGTLRGIIRQAESTVDTFVSLLDQG